MCTEKEISAMVLTMLVKLNAKLVAAGYSPADSLKVQVELMLVLASVVIKMHRELQNPVEL